METNKKGIVNKDKNDVYVHFKERGENFTLDVPHKNVWEALLRFLKKRGFKVSANPCFVKNYTCLSKYHKLCLKNDIVALLEITPMSIVCYFGNVKNLWDNKQSMWKETDSLGRGIKLSYLEKIAIQVEVNKVAEFLCSFNLDFIDKNIKLSPEQKIIANLRNNTHIHGKVEKLQDIKNHITEDSYDYKINSNDANKKKIICGEIKYFYDYKTRRIHRGEAWHNINNMWWVIVNGDLRNVAAFELFDYSPSIPKRKKVEKSKLSSLIKAYSEKMEFERCIGIRNYAQKIGVELNS